MVENSSLGTGKAFEAGMNDNDIVWRAMMRAVKGSASGIVGVEPCPVCRVEGSRLWGYASREGHVVARCNQDECWGNGTTGIIATRLTLQ